MNAAFEDAANGALKGILGFDEAPLVSIDFNGNPLSSIVDAEQTQVVGGDLVEVHPGTTTSGASATAWSTSLASSRRRRV